MVPTQVVDDITLVGPAARIRDELPRWEDVGRHLARHRRPSTIDEMRQVAEVVLG